MEAFACRKKMDTVWEHFFESRSSSSARASQFGVVSVPYRSATVILITTGQD